MLRKILVALSLVGLVAVVAPAPAQAEQTGTVVFTAGAEVCHDLDDDDPNNGTNGPDGRCTENGNDVAADFWAPAAPGSDCTDPQPGLCDAPANVWYDFSTDNEGLGGEKFCAGVGSEDGTTASDSGAEGDRCTLESTGSVNPGIATVGPYCGYSSGIGTSNASLDNGAVSITGVTVRWPQSAGTVLPLIFSQGGTSPADTIGVGSVQTTGAQPGTCGLDPNTNFDSTNSFAVSGFATIAIP